MAFGTNCRICSGSVHLLENADVLFLGAAGSFLDVVAPNQQGCRVLHISKHERAWVNPNPKNEGPASVGSRIPCSIIVVGLATGHFDISSADRDRHGSEPRPWPVGARVLDPKMTNQRVDREGGRNISAPWAANSEPCPPKGLTDPIEKSTSVIVA